MVVAVTILFFALLVIGAPIYLTLGASAAVIGRAHV